MSGNRPVWRFFRFWSKYALYRRIYAYIRSFLSKIPKTVTVRWIPANPQRIQVGHPWVHLDGSDGVHGLAPCLRNPRCIFVSYRDLRWDFRHEHLKMSSPAGAHRCSRYVICSPDYSGAGMSVAGNVASCMAVTWLVRTDGFFATSRDTTSLDPADQSSNISSTNIVLQRTILCGRRISLSWPAHRGTCIARSMAMGHAMSVAKSSVRWLTSTKTNFRKYRKFQKWIDFGWCYNFIEMSIYDLLINSCCTVMSWYFYFLWCDRFSCTLK